MGGSAGAAQGAVCRAHTHAHTHTREFARGVGILTGVGIPAQTLGLSIFTCVQELWGGVGGSFLSDKARGREGRRSETRRRGEGYE